MSVPPVASASAEPAPPGSTIPRVTLGVGTQLGMGFVAVAVLALSANLLLQGGQTAVRTRVERVAPEAATGATPSAVAAPRPAPAPLRPRGDAGRAPGPDPVAASPSGSSPATPVPAATPPGGATTPRERGPGRRPAPSPEALVATLAEHDRRLLESLPWADRPPSGESPSRIEPVPATDAEVRAALEAATARFLRDATAVGAPAGALRELQARLVRHEAEGEALRASAARREAQFDEFQRSLAALEATLRQPLDRSLKLFGRTFARESVIAVNQGLDAVRQRASEAAGPPPLRAEAVERLVAAEAILVALLDEHSASLAKLQGEQWMTGLRARRDALLAARQALVQTDAAHALAWRQFGGDAPAIADTIRGLSRRLARQQAAVAADAARAAARAEAEAGKAAEAEAALVAAAALAASADAAELPPPGPVPLVRTVTEKITTESVSSVSLLWVTGTVLGLLLLTTIVTIRGVTGPVRRLTEATRKLARGERNVQVPSGGARELDALGEAFNDMARQLDAARTALEHHQHRLESQVAERTRDLQHLAENDPLTRLPNRRHLFTRLSTAIARARASHGGVAVMFLDVDNFKIINDSLSHEFGDQVLQQVSERLRSVVGDDGFCARLGGDEFTVVHEGAMSLAALGDLAARLVVAFEPPLRVGDQELKVTVSVGVSKFPEHAQDAEGLLRAADTALFRSKERGRNQFALFNQEMLEEAARKFTIEQGLHGAIERDELRLVYQPELSLEGNRAVAVEALLRWQRADGRLVSPGEFLAVAEQSRLILDIGDWVMRRAIAKAAEWHRGPWPEVRIAVNVSPRQLLDGRFVARVAGLLREHQLPPRCLEVELTESVLQTGPATVEALRQLRALGVSIALDDFGTGYSSLASLEQLPLSRVKLDRSLISTIDTSERSFAIAHAIIELCRGLGLEVTAEGIERPAQFALLARERDVTLQGYLFSRPVPEVEWLALLPQVAARLEQQLLSTPLPPPLRVVPRREPGSRDADSAGAALRRQTPA
ncbi:MAG: EAL domain-containing protein [Steroidobacteraceae bacterium]|jgi:diguanylate cyclase (GGDEF)-like protein|nr:EAL domain-containing protein [Steroidobacteraceae bacterium]